MGMSDFEKKCLLAGAEVDQRRQRFHDILDSLILKDHRRMIDLINLLRELSSDESKSDTRRLVAFAAEIAITTHVQNRVNGDQ